MSVQQHDCQSEAVPVNQALCHHVNASVITRGENVDQTGQPAIQTTDCSKSVETPAALL